MNVTSRFIIVYVLMAATWGFLHFHVDKAPPVVRTLDEFPAALQDWHMTSQSRFSEDILNILKPTDYLARQYSGSSGKNIGLYIGYHDGGRESGEIHSPKNCLPGSGWQEISTDRINLSTPHGHVNLVKAIYEKGGIRELYFYWFQVQDKTLSNEYSLKCAEIMNSLVYGRKDATFIRICIPFETDEKSAESAGINFIKEVYPLIGNFIPS